MKKNGNGSNGMSNGNGNGNGKHTPRVSILLPCRDAQAYLPDTIASVMAQTFQDAEIIAVDDGSQDGTRSLLQAWALRDSRVKVIAQ